MKYRVSVTKVVEATKTFEIEAEGLDVMYNPEHAEVLRNFAKNDAIKDDFTDAEMTETKFIIGGIEVVEDNPYIDYDGNPYIEDKSFPAGGGLHRDCEFNADALYALYMVRDRDKITAYLTSKGFTPFDLEEDYEEWEKGNTLVTYEGYDHLKGRWGYMRTELIREPNMVI